MSLSQQHNAKLERRVKMKVMYEVGHEWHGSKKAPENAKIWRDIVNRVGVN